MKESRRCAVCGKEFTAFYPSHRFCSRACHRRSTKHDSVTLKCVICGKEFDVPYHRRKSIETCSKGCKVQLRSQTIDWAAFGAAISRTRIEGIANGTIVPKGHPCPDWLREKMKIIGSERIGPKNGMFGRTHVESSRAAMSETRTRKLAAGEYDRSKWSRKGTVESVKANRTIPYRSSWELRAIEMLEADQTVRSFKFEPMRIPYQQSEGQIRNYVPDFLIEYVDGTRKLVEVKPKCYLGSKMTVLKADAAREFCEEIGATFEFWTQDDLFEKE